MTPRPNPVAVLIGVVVLFATSGAAVDAQSGDVAYPVEARDLIVRIESVARPDPMNPSASVIPQFGSGIAFAAPTNASLYIATALHVVADAGSIRVRFAFEDELRDAELVWETEGLDVAVLELDVPEAVVSRVVGSFDRFGRPARLGPGSAVYPVGCPDGQCWGIPGVPDRVLSSADLVLDFQSTYATGGSSGGGLFDDNWELVGMVLRNDIPRAEAIPVDALMDVVRGLSGQDDAVRVTVPEWDRMTQLRTPSVPRGGYRTTIGLSVIHPLTQTAPISPTNPPIDLSNHLDTRVPGLRLTLTRQSETGNDWHVGVMRLAPYNTTITAFVGGLATEFRTSGGRVLLRPFIEGGFARVEARHDVGGFFLGSMDPANYEPVWAKVERDAIGFGGGTSFELTLFPSVILEFNVGGWSFGMPQEIGDTPRFYSGAGLRIGR